MLQHWFKTEPGTIGPQFEGDWDCQLALPKLSAKPNLSDGQVYNSICLEAGIYQQHALSNLGT